MQNCYICSSVLTSHFKNVNGFDIIRCKQCGLVWVVNATEKVIIDFYNSNYFNNDSKMGYKDYLADEGNHRKNSCSLLSIVDKKKNLSGCRILDIGCGYGFLLDEARKFKKLDAYGVEVILEACKYAKNKFSLNVKNCLFDEANFDKDFFDVIFLVGTIEHLISPGDTLREINTILKPGGILVITTLDLKGVLPIFSLKPPEHLFYFDHHNICLLLDKFGYKVILKKGHWCSYFFHDLWYRLSNFLSFNLLNKAALFAEKHCKFSIKIPTNEMIVISEKVTTL